jgi:MYXO-CTERM domain-containing protein
MLVTFVLSALVLFGGSAQAANITVTSGGPYTVSAGSSVTLTASTSGASGSCTENTFRWDVDADGTWDTSYSSSSSTTFDADGATYDGPTTVSPVVEVYDTRCLATDTDTDTITIDNVAPAISSTSITTSVDETESQTMSVSYTDVEELDTHSITWDFGDGTTGTGSSVSKSYDDDGSYTVTVTVTDDDGGEDSTTATVTVDNVAPDITATSGTSSVDEGSSFSRTCTANDTSEDTISWDWDWGDGNTTSSSGTGSSDTQSHSYVDEGTGSYIVTCTASDEDGGSSNETSTITVSNVAPVASASGSTTADEGDTVTYTCSSSDVGTSDSVSYAWAFSDGDVATGSSVTHTWADDGSATATCTATDDDSDSDSDTVTTVVSNLDPSIDTFSTTSSADEGDSLSFVCDASDEGDDTVSTEWDFGDGDSSTSATTTHTYADDGSYTATCDVSDEDGGSSSQSTSITIANVAPSIDSSSFSTSGDEGESLSFSASASDPGDDTVSYEWDFDDGTTSSSASSTHTWSDNGTFTVTLTVSDEDGGSSSSSETVIIDNVAPVISALTGDSAGDEGSTLSWLVSYSDDGSDDTFTVSWDYGDGDTGSGDSVSHAYEEDGSYSLSVEVCDNNGDCDTETETIAVANAAPVISSFSGDTVGNEADSFSATCTASDAGASDTLTYLITWGDGNSTTSSSDSNTYDDDGSYTATCTVTDDDGDSDTESYTVIVSSVDPTIDSMTSSQSGDEGDVLTFTASASDPGADTITYTWDFGDGEESTGSSVTHTYTDDDSFTYTLTVTDEDGGESSGTGTATIANVDPTVTISVDNSTADEGDELTFSSEVEDPGTDDTQTCVWDWGNGDTDTEAPGDIAYTYTDDSSYTVTYTCVDDDGGTGNDSLTVTISNVAPEITSLSGDTEGDEGDELSFGCAASDVSSDDTVSITWDFGDGSSGSGEDATNTYATEGTYTVRCTATDDDGGSSSDSFDVEISNVAPTIDSLTTDTSGEEGETLSFSGSASDPGSGDTLSWSWDWGDGNTDTGDSVTHAWGDNAEYTVTVSVDDGTETTSQTFTVTTTNVAPEISGTPDTEVYSETAYIFSPSATDPGTDDVLTWTGTYPGTASLDPSTGELTWTPLYTEADTYAIELVVTDDDGELDSISWSLEVVFLDDDGDGMSDAWETEHGLDPTDSTDGSDDDDGDGITNYDEYLDGTEPDVYDGPSEPTGISPEDATEVADAEVVLTIENAESPRDETMTYTFEVYDDEGLTSLVASGTGVVQDSSGETSWTIDATLAENTWHYWQVAGSDPYVTGAYSAPMSFFYNTENDAPEAPQISLPFDGSSIADLQATLVLDEAFDLDEDPLTYDLVLMDTDGNPLESISALEGDGYEVRWETETTLTDLETYCWVGWATDDEGLEGPESDTACFTVDTSNEAPSEPSVLAPEDTYGINTETAAIVVLDGVDPEGRSVELWYQLGTDPSYGDEGRQEGTVVADGTGQTTWSSDLLEDDTWYYGRVLTSDGSTTSNWTNHAFYVDLDNNEPTVPELSSPIGGELVSSGTALTFLNSEDPDGGSLTYEAILYDADGEELSFEALEEGESGSTSWDMGALDDGTYSWTVRAIDESLLPSDWAEDAQFEVGEPDEPGDTGDTGDDGGDDSGDDGISDDNGDPGGGTDEGKAGCGCSSTSAMSAAPLGVVWLLIGLAGFVARRREDG